jgi:hypothetical protein
MLRKEVTFAPPLLIRRFSESGEGAERPARKNLTRTLFGGGVDVGRKMGLYCLAVVRFSRGNGGAEGTDSFYFDNVNLLAIEIAP